MTTTTTGLTVLDTATSKGVGELNEDLAGSAGPYAWMFDGATDTPETFRPDPDVTGAYWISHTCDTWLRSRPLTRRPPGLVTSLATHVAESLRLAGMPDDGLPPVCSMGIVRRTDAQVEAAIVGDVFIYHAGKYALLSNPVFGRNEHTAVRTQRDTRQSPQEAAAGITARRRGYLKGRDGAWVLGNNPAVGADVLFAAWDYTPGDLLLLATDGFARAVTDYHLAESWTDLTNLVVRRSAARVIQMIRDHEASTDQSAPFFKKSDDACVTLLQLS
ncbi:protein phosphatase 2C domain-containing protein [Antribacter sp. KLBMP9083]|uniref:Protein phosphatase 2C domain-containing protein n=1 Tax=Antribacter soli TaxID=2910976 RepID=A0AA41UAT3_9MICO|nr:protein phosphatase 2C domain-containing protein [Antribacter soli]MCF4123032.1 protein phosphatase 2C domain-containing protein [Antribacter soli]